MVFNTNISLITASTTVDIPFNNYLISATGGNITVTLPLIRTDGMNFNFKRIDTTGNTVTIQGTGGQTIAGGNPSLGTLSAISLQSYISTWYRYSPTGATGGNTVPTSNQVVTFGSGTSFLNGISSPVYASASGIDGAERDASILMSQGGTASNLYVMLQNNPGGTNSRTFTLRKNNVAQSLTCTISGASTTGNDTVNTFSVVPGDRITLECTIAATANATFLAASIILTT